MISPEKMNDPFGNISNTIPNSFDNQLSYYESLQLLMNYIKEAITKLNLNADAVIELQKFYDELKIHVDNYFTNLNIQTEINNKLDIMTSNGTLASIINQQIFTQLNNDLSTLNNTVTANKTATDQDINDIEASISDINNDITENKTNSDQNISLINTNILNINNNIKNKKYGLIAISRNTTNNDHYLYYSEDMEKFYRVGEKLDKLTSDAGALININGRYYYIGNNTYQFSDDLVNWSDPLVINDTSDLPYTTPYGNIWAPYPFYDKISNKYYMYYSYQYKGDIASNVFGNSWYFKIVCQEFTVNENGTLSFGEMINIRYVDNQSYIDPAICYDNVHGYIFALKNELTCKIELYHGTSPILIDANPYAILEGVGTEGPQLISDNGFITMYVHDYALGSIINTNLVTDLPQTYCSVNIAHPTRLYTSTYLQRHACLMPEIFRHAGICKCDKNSLNLISSIGIIVTKLYKHDQYEFYNPKHIYYVIAKNGQTFNLPNFPDCIYQLGGGAEIGMMTLNLHAYFDSPLKFASGPTHIKWGGDADTTNEITSVATDHVLLELPIVFDNHIMTPMSL